MGMITYRRFAQLNRQAQAQQQSVSTVPLNRQKAGAMVNSLSPLSLRAKARILALAEALHISPDDLFTELLDSALGDAHEGYLAIYPERDDRLTADSALKARVGQLQECLQ